MHSTQYALEWAIHVALPPALALGSGLMAGVFFAFSAFVMTALDDRPAAEAIATMQRINVRVLNAWFLGVFMGTAVLGLAVAAAGIWMPGPQSTAWSVAAAVVYGLGVFGVTAGFNVPMNAGLARLHGAHHDLPGAWRDYRVPWTLWNHARSSAASMSALLWTIASQGSV